MPAGCQQWLSALRALWSRKFPRQPARNAQACQLVFEAGQSQAQGMREYMEDSNVVHMHIFPNEVLSPLPSPARC
jgi:hypothetical protein